MRKFATALGNAVVESGRVDILACSLIKKGSPGEAIFAKLAEDTHAKFAASKNLSGSPADNTADWVMESDGTNIRDIYFKSSIDAKFDGTFEVKAEGNNANVLKAQVRTYEQNFLTRTVVAAFWVRVW